MENRRVALRRERLKEKLLVEVQEASDPGLWSAVVQAQEMCGEPLVAIWVDRALEESEAKGAVNLDAIIEQVQCDMRFHVDSSNKAPVKGITDELFQDLCGFCKARMTDCQCRAASNKPVVFSDKMLQDEYSMLAFAQAQCQKEQECMDQLVQNQKKREYANELASLMEERKQRERQEREARLNEQKVLDDRARVYEREQSLKREQERQHRQQNCDALDNFCQLQRERDEQQRQQEEEETLRLQRIARENEQSELRRKEERAAKVREQTLAERENLERERQRRAELALQAKKDDLNYILEAQQVEQAKQEARERARREVLEKSTLRSNIMAEQIGSLQEERKKALETSFERWERERREQEERKFQEDQALRAAQARELTRARSRQILEKELLQQREEAERLQYTDALTREIRHQEEEERIRQQRAAEQRKQYRTVLMQQMHEEEERKKRGHVGMNDVERALNQPLMRSLNLIDSKGGLRECWSGTCVGFCTCDQDIRNQRYLIQTTRD